MIYLLMKNIKYIFAENKHFLDSLEKEFHFPFVPKLISTFFNALYIRLCLMQKLVCYWFLLSKKIMGMKDVMMQTVEEIVSKGASKQVGHLWATDEQLDVPWLQINGRKLISFVLCDYLSLSQDERVINSSIEMLKRYGTYTAVSRAFVNLNLVRETEDLLGKIFNKPVAVIARTTLAHLAVLPVITQTTDAIILDHQVHTSVRNAVDMLKPYGNKVEVIRHNRMDQLESRLQKLSDHYTKVWYMADGIYSMYGDTLPVDELQ